MIWIQSPEFHNEEIPSSNKTIENAVNKQEEETNDILKHYQKIFGIND